MQLLILCYF